MIAIEAVPTFSMNIREAMLIYGELMQCYYKKNGYGGDTAEIYAYRCGQMTATVYRAIGMNEKDLASTTILREALEDFSTDAARNLATVCQQFSKVMDVDIEIDDKPLAEGVEPFAHRVHVKVIKR